MPNKCPLAVAAAGFFVWHFSFDVVFFRVDVRGDELVKSVI